MKFCDTCRTTYPNDFTTCPRDQTVLRVTSELTQGMVIREKYEILGKIGAGGMATVYRARHLAFNEIRAIKVVSARLLDDETFIKRFKTEAIVTRKLQHPNAVRVDDLDTTDDGRPFIIMELVEGRDLRKVIHEEGPFPVARAVDITRQAAAALGAAHALGITHRDIKPDNLLLVPQPDGTERVKVLDFGIAKVKEGAMDMGAGYTATKTGMVVGTPQYVSPEQAMGKQGEAIDGRSDLYSLGVVLYEMLTGQLPFDSDTPVGLLLHHIQTMPTPPNRLRPDLQIPEGISVVLMTLLEKDREHRIQSAADLIEAVDSLPAGFEGTALMGSDDVSAAIPSGPASGTAVGVSTPTRFATPPRPVTPLPKPATPRPAQRPAAAAAPATTAGHPAPAAPLPAASSNWKKPAMVAAVVVVLLIAGLGYRAATRSEPEAQPQSVAPASGGSSGATETLVAGADSGGAATQPQAVGATAGPQPAEPPPAEVDESAPDPEKPELKQRMAQALVARARQDAAQGNYDAAIRKLERAARLDPQNAEVQEALRRARRARKTELEVLRRRR